MLSTRSKESRALWKIYGIALILTVSASLIIAALTVFLCGGAHVQLVSNTVGMKPTFYWIWRLAQWPIAVFFVSLIASMVYYAAPNLKQRCWQWLSPGALFATLGWIAASGLLRLYFHFFTSYAKTYGPLGAVMVLLTWLYVTGVMLLLGAEVNMVIEAVAALGGQRCVCVVHFGTRWNWNARRARTSRLFRLCHRRGSKVAVCFARCKARARP
jgi:membrane protein